MLVAFLCGQFLSVEKCELRPVQVLQYLGIVCDSTSMTFRIPQDKLDKLHALLRQAVDDKGLSYRTLQRIAGKCMSMTVAIPPASLWTHAMFAVLASLEKAGSSRVDLSRDDRADLLGEFRQWLSLTTTSHEARWRRARHLLVRLQGASDASSRGYGGTFTIMGSDYHVGGGFPEDWLGKHINKKEMFALYHSLRLGCARFPSEFHRAQVLMDVDNTAVLGSFNRGRARDPETHGLLVRLFDLQVAHDFVLSLQWVPSAANGVAGAISRPSRESIVRLKPAAFRTLWDVMGPFEVDLMASDVSVQRHPSTGIALPFFSRYDCEGTAGIDFFAQIVALHPTSRETALSYCFPPPVLVGPVVQHLAECHAHAVVLVTDVRAYWFPVLRQASVRSVMVSPMGARGFFHWPSQDGSLREWRYPRWSMVAHELDFRSV